MPDKPHPELTEAERELARAAGRTLWDFMAVKAIPDFADTFEGGTYIAEPITYGE
jgi:hypothetical protein